MMTGHVHINLSATHFNFYYNKDCGSNSIVFGNVTEDNSYPAGGSYWAPESWFNGAFTQFVEVGEGNYCIELKAQSTLTVADFNAPTFRCINFNEQN